MEPEEHHTSTEQNAEAWVEREPSTEDPQHTYQNTPPPQDPYQSQASTPQPVTPQLPSAPAPAKKHRPAFIISAIIIVIVVIFGGLIGMMLIMRQLQPVKKTVPTTHKQTTAPTSLQSYVKTSNKSLVVTRDSKTITTVLLPSGKDHFTTLAANDKSLVALAVKNSKDTSPEGFLVKSDGSSQALTPSIAATISRQTTFGTATGYLDQNSNFLNVHCKDTSCALDSINLTSGTSNTILTEGFTPQKQKSPSTSIALLGISATNAAYLITYSGNNTTDPVGTLISVDLDSGSTQKSLIMPKAAAGVPTFSPDFNYALYTQSQDNATGNLITWMDGTNKQVSGSISNGTQYLWAPDSKRALFLNNPQGQTSTLGMISAGNAAQTVLKTFSTSSTTSLTVLGWLDNTTIEYQLSTSGKITTHTFNVDSGQDKVVPAAKSQTLLPATSPLHSS